MIFATSLDWSFYSFCEKFINLNLVFLIEFSHILFNLCLIKLVVGICRIRLGSEIGTLKHIYNLFWGDRWKSSTRLKTTKFFVLRFRCSLSQKTSFDNTLPKCINVCILLVIILLKSWRYIINTIFDVNKFLNS